MTLKWTIFGAWAVGFPIAFGMAAEWGVMTIFSMLMWVAVTSAVAAHLAKN